MPRLLTKLRIREVSAVTRGAGEDCRIMITKRLDDDEPGTSSIRKIFGRLTAKNWADARNLVLKRAPDRNSLARIAWADFRPPVLKRENILKNRKEQSMTTLEDVVKRNGLISVAKGMTEAQDAYGVTEAQLTDMIMQEAVKTKKAGQTDAQAFAEFYAAPENLPLRKALQLTKSTPTRLEPVRVAPTTHETGRTDVESDAQEAYAALTAKAEELRRSAPYLSVSQAFARVFEDTKNAALAARAHRRPEPTTSYAFPRG